MESLALAFDKLNKVYESCKTVEQFTTATTYRNLFWKMYGNIIFESKPELRKEIIVDLEATQATIFTKIVRPKKILV